MSFAVCQPDEAIEELAEGAWMLAAHQAQIRFWQQRFLMASAQPVCATPHIHTWSSWLQLQAAQLAGFPVPLNRLQEQWLWEQIIADDLPNLSDPTLHGLVEHAQQAYGLMRLYDISIEELESGGEEAEALGRWIRAMQRRMQQPGERVLAADVPELLVARMTECPFPRRWLLSGFASLTPQQQRFFSAVQQAGASVAIVESDAAAVEMHLRACRDEQEEFRQIAAAIEALMRHDATLSIAIAVHEQIDMAALGRILDEVLLPELRWQARPAYQAATMPGTPLRDDPLIQQILHVLALAGQQRLRFDQCAPLLFSPWLKGYAEECGARAELDKRLRQYNRHQLSYDDLLYLSRGAKLTQWHAVLRQLVSWPRERKRASEWVQLTHILLQAAGAMQYAAASAQDTRLINAFRDVLLSLAAIDAVGEPMPWPRFLSLLSVACARAMLPRPSRYPQLSIVPLSALAGLHFDYVFVPGLDEERFPAPARPHPLLPVHAQTTHGLPLSNAALAYAQARWQWQQLQQAGNRVEISYAVQRDEKTLLPSAFAGSLTPAAEREIDGTPGRWPMQPFPDTPLVPLRHEEAVSGGTAILKNQSACPFRAFAVHRLAIDTLEATMPGLTPGDKGSLLHRALEHIWATLRSRQVLADLDQAQRDALITDAISVAWQRFVPATAAVRQCECRRMHEILTDWLELELERPGFTVLATEQRYQMHLPENGVRQFQLTVTADRLDEDAAGRRILIDYKTGARQSFSRWLGERMEEPQLPLYALAAGLETHDVVAFARVRRGEMGFEGLSGEDTGIQGIVVCNGQRGLPEDWDTLLQQWREQLHALADAFVRGACEVAPRNAQACRYCGLEAFCRIAEIGFSDGEEEGA